LGRPRYKGTAVKVLMNKNHGTCLDGKLKWKIFVFILANFITFAINEMLLCVTSFWKRGCYDERSV